MNIRIVVAMVVAATAVTSAFADGGHDYPGAYGASSASSTRGAAAVAPASSSGNSAPSGKTREQVRQELIRAYHDGLLPTSNHDYPPGPETIARNKELHSLREPVWAAQH
ncbi:hypothetical protein BGV56_03745 [Burkholderia ubonensis]|uniref:DUF4148 domain-containing protein n=1 Tax=Burkholderia ubonensis TaxID=101571 RepID=UPI0008FDCEAA|nr:DUF4148 domain-containing protein [Burkholderia ubonensis]OJA25627.1 hypothetical protein BGV47_30555 [Burkholderia ubonensis]OJB32310.1 hypothetical protein BGV55_07495 [Burkholderia ubonensis]OJB39570.1 hypothetical protein BGV56_03745 [Burkholderia ubonensis]